MTIFAEQKPWQWPGKQIYRVKKTSNKIYFDDTTKFMDTSKSRKTFFGATLIYAEKPTVYTK